MPDESKGSYALDNPSTTRGLAVGPSDVGVQISDPAVMTVGADAEFNQSATDFETRADYISALYREEFGRDPDQAGLDFWVDSGFNGADLMKRMREAAGLDSTLYEDPAYAAFIRRMRQQEGTIEADREARAREIENQRQLTNAVYNRQQQQGFQRIDQDAEARGMLRSGGRITNRADLVTDINTNRAGTESNAAASQAELNRQAAADVADLSRQRDEEEVAARNRLTNQSIQEAANG